MVPPEAPAGGRRPGFRPAGTGRRRRRRRRRRRGSTTQAPVRESFRDVKFRIQNRVIQDLDPKLDLSNQVEVRRQIEEIFGKVIDEEGLALTRAERVRMLEQITDEIIGLGPLEPLLRDESITEVMVNGPRQVYIERSGKLELTNVVFQNDDHVMRIIDRIIAPIGRRVDESSPMVDARLTDGSRVNAIIPPLSLVGPVITIRKFSASPFTVDDLIRFGTATARHVRLPPCLRGGSAEHLRLRRHRLGQDDDPQRPLLVHPERRADRDHRGRRRAPAPPGARGDPRVAPAEHRGQGRDPDPRARPQRPAHAARPDHRRGVPFRRGARHAPGHEHRPRRLDVHRPRQHPARHARRASRRWS